MIAEQVSANSRQNRLLALAVLFGFLYSLALTFAPAVRQHSLAVPLRWAHWLGFAVWAGGFWLIHRHMAVYLPDADPLVLPTASLLTGWGLLTVWRLDESFGLRQTLWLALALIALIGLIQRRGLLEWLRRYKYLWLVAGLLGTAATFAFGTFPGGSGPRLWLGCCGVYFQPSEPLKLLLVIYLAGYLSTLLPNRLNLFGMLGPSVVLLLAALGLLIAQRDLGTAVLVIAIYMLTFYLASGKRRLLLLPILGVLAGSYAGYRLFEVVRVRFTSWINPWQDAGGSSYQIIQSLISIAAGGVFGTGPGLGSPGLVPIAHSDFIFSAIGEEMGLVGVIGIILLYALFFNRAMVISLSASDRYRRYLAAGVGVYIGVQALMIAGGAIRLVPLTGATLPFVSYGGSSLVTAVAAMLLLLECSPQAEEEPVWLMNTSGYTVVPLLMYMGFAAVALLAGWWMLVRQPALLNRSDNARRYITERYVQRGSILDRHDIPLVSSTGDSGDYVRRYASPELSLVTGYDSPLLGQAGLEAGLDSYLQGLRGLPASTVWWHQLVFGQTPPGLNVRTSLDINFQNISDRLLQDHTGAAVMLNASNGEILAMSSAPGYDANQFISLTNREESAAAWAELVKSDRAPLVNRAALGQYNPGPILAPLMLLETSSRINLPDPFLNHAALTQGDLVSDCITLPPRDQRLTWAALIQAGCPQVYQNLSDFFVPSQMEVLFRRLGFFTQPDLPLETALISIRELPSLVSEFSQPVSPLQLALAGAVLSNGGRIPEPMLALSVETPQQVWVVLKDTQLRQTFDSAASSETARSLAKPGKFYWQAIARARQNGSILTWYLGGTLPAWQGIPLSVAVLLEENNPALAEQIGESLLEAAIR